MSDQETVSVPRGLLARVLEVAKSNSYSTESEFSCNAAESKEYAEERDRIDELRKAAGLDEVDVTGQGFFGIALALKDKAGSV